MSISYVHLSDIHFGQEKGESFFLNGDAKLRLVEDVRASMALLNTGKVEGLIVSGDIAYAGKASEYADAGKWLDAVAEAAGCKATDVQVVPGNHDVDIDKISAITNLALSDLLTNGQQKLETYLAAEEDRDLLYRRFSGYIPFAEGYDCALDREGGGAGERRVELAPGKYLKFVGLNTALLCKKKDAEGTLLLGARQRVLTKTHGEELIVVAHHPLRWLQDSEDARKFVKNRALVFISGHEHMPKIEPIECEGGKMLLILESGAAVPPVADQNYTYTYNLIQFSLDNATNVLLVEIFPRAWDDEKKCFGEDKKFGKKLEFRLPCSNFPDTREQVQTDEPAEVKTTIFSHPSSTDVGEMTTSRVLKMDLPKSYSKVLLHFFRELDDHQRLEILLALGGLPKEWDGPLTNTLERRCFDQIVAAGKISELEIAVEKFTLGEK